MRILFAIGWALAGAILIFAAVLGAHDAGYIVVFPEQKYQIELASLFLVAATLIITTIAILLAVVAAVGYTALRDAAVNAGRGAGETAARELLAEMVQRE